MERKDDKSFKRDIIVLISFPILFVSTSFLLNIGKEITLPGFRTYPKSRIFMLYFGSLSNIKQLSDFLYDATKAETIYNKQ